MSTASHRWIPRALAAVVVGALALGAAACGSGAVSSQAGSSQAGSSQAGSTGAGSASSEDGVTPDSGAKATITLYSGQHEAFAQQLADGFAKATGITVVLRSGDDAELANQIVEEGGGSPADVFISEEPGPAAMLAAKGLTSPIGEATYSQADSRLNPANHLWQPYAARSRAIVYNPSLISEADLPKSILDLTEAKWKGQFAYAPSGAFTSTVSYLISTIGSDKTLAWLKGIKANGVNEQKNGKVRDSVEAGQHPFGLTNHYYWYILAAQKGGAANLKSKVYFFDHDDAGGLLLTSGAAVLKSSKHQVEAQEFVKWLVAADGGQQIVADGDAAQFPVNPAVNSKSDIPTLAELHFPQVDPSVYADTSEAKDLIIKAGIA